VLTNLQIVPGTASSEASAVFDVSADQLSAASFAVSYHLRWRFGGEVLDVGETLTMRTLVAVGDQLATLAEAEAHGTLFLAAAGGALLHEAVSTYVTMRDLESHQSVQERARLAILGDLLVDLRDLCVSLGEASGSDQPLCPA
jgi:hypothetical protein